MFNADQGPLLDGHRSMEGKKLYVGIVQARFNAQVSDALLEACHAELLRLGVAPRNITCITVPGALEVPVALQALAQQERYDALVALGCVIRGETYHFELVANESARAIARVALDAQLPIANAILTVENLQQAQERQHVKGTEAARVAVEMANLINAMA